MYNERYDAYVIGCGITGSIIARALAEDYGKKVLILEKRKHIAGNLYDEKNSHGILIQKYGPHIFHTNKKEIYEFLLRFGEWKPYKLTCMVYMNGKSTPSPFNYQTIDDYFEKEKALKIKEHIEMEFQGRAQTTIVEMLRSKDPYVSEYANYLFKYDYSLYTAKQWGISPDEIDISVLNRVPVLFSYKQGYFNDKYEVMPVNGFTSIVEKILDHPNIEVQLGKNACNYLNTDNGGKNILWEGNKVKEPIIFTGPIDELFQYRFGPLPYRSLRFEYETVQMDSFQEAPVVAYPQESNITRITEYKKLPEQDVPGVSTIAKEYPLQYDSKQVMEPYYPIPTEENTEKYKMYYRLAEKINNLYICGRLGDYKYYNMDQAIERAFELIQMLKRGLSL